MGRFPWDSHRNDIPMDKPGYHRPAEAFRKNFQIWNLLKSARLDLFHWAVCAEWSAFAQEQWTLHFLCTIIDIFICFTIKLEGHLLTLRYSTILDKLCVVRYPAVRCLEQHICSVTMNSAPTNKSVCLSAKRGLLKVAPSQNLLPVPAFR